MSVRTPISFAWPTNDLRRRRGSLRGGFGLERSASPVRTSVSLDKRSPSKTTWPREADAEAARSGVQSDQLTEACVAFRDRLLYVRLRDPHALRANFVFSSAAAARTSSQPSTADDDGDRPDARRQHFIDIRRGDARNGDGRDRDRVGRLPRRTPGRRRNRAAWCCCGRTGRRRCSPPRRARPGGPARCVRADADDHFAADQLPHFVGRQIVLADVDAVGVAEQRDVGAVVDDRTGRRAGGRVRRAAGARRSSSPPSSSFSRSCRQSAPPRIACSAASSQGRRQSDSVIRT